MGGPPAGEKLFVPDAGKDRVQAIDGRGDHSHQPEFGDETLKQITAPAVRSWLAAMSEEGLAPSAVYDYRRALARRLLG